jgi:hypothetical protein
MEIKTDYAALLRDRAAKARLAQTLPESKALSWQEYRNARNVEAWRTRAIARGAR